jgi:hypothetical protein
MAYVVSDILEDCSTFPKDEDIIVLLNIRNFLPIDIVSHFRIAEISA